MRPQIQLSGFVFNLPKFNLYHTFFLCESRSRGGILIHKKVRSLILYQKNIQFELIFLGIGASMETIDIFH